MHIRRTFACKHYERWICYPEPTPKPDKHFAAEDIIDLDWIQNPGKPTKKTIQDAMLEVLWRRYPDIVHDPVCKGGIGGFGRVFQRICERVDHTSGIEELRATVFTEPHLQAEGWSAQLPPPAVQAFKDYVIANRVGYATCWIRGDDLVRAWGSGWITNKIATKDWDDYPPTITRVIYDQQAFHRKLAGAEKQKRTNRKKLLKQAILNAAVGLTTDEIGEVLVEIFGGRV